MVKDLTIGKVDRVLWRFCIPLFGSVIFQQLYNIADSLIAGKLVGESALAAIGNSYEITLVFLSFAFGCNIGCSIVVSHYFGAKNYKACKSTVSTVAITCVILCSVLMIFGLLLTNNLLLLINTPETLLNDSALYLKIYILGLPFLFFYNIATGIFSALGDSKTPFIFLAISSTANIGADILMVTAFKMGVAGVAWATFICQSVSCILAVIVVLNRLKELKTDGKIKVFSIPILNQFIYIAIPSTLQQCFVSVGNVILQSCINSFGPSVIAGYAAGVKLNNLVIFSFATIGNGVSNFTAQNIGAKQLARVKKGLISGIKLALLISIPFFICFFFFGEFIIGLFIDNPTMQAMQTGIIFLRILSPFYFIISTKLIADGVLRGSKKMTSFMISTFLDIILRVGIAFIIANMTNDPDKIWFCWPIGWTIATVFSLSFYKFQISRKQNVDEIIHSKI